MGYPLVEGELDEPTLYASGQGPSRKFHKEQGKQG